MDNYKQIVLQPSAAAAGVDQNNTAAFTMSSRFARSSPRTSSAVQEERFRPQSSFRSTWWSTLISFSYINCILLKLNYCLLDRFQVKEMEGNFDQMKSQTIAFKVYSGSSGLLMALRSCIHLLHTIIIFFDVSLEALRDGRWAAATFAS